MRKISLITMGQGNVQALKKTIESFLPFVDEVVYGDVLIFEEDGEVVRQYESDYPFRSIRIPFNYIFQMGFSNVLNYLISNAKNDMVLYMNTSEVVEENYGINEIIDDYPSSNVFFFTNRNERHRWFRCFDRREVEWGGRIHEEPIGNLKPYHKSIFLMKDEEKDMDDPFKAAVFNSVKEMTYWRQLMYIVDNPSKRGATNEGWLNYAKEQYQSMAQRLAEKGSQYTAFKIGDFDMFLNDIYNSDYFKTARFESSTLINFQGARKDIL